MIHENIENIYKKYIIKKNVTLEETLNEKNYIFGNY